MYNNSNTSPIVGIPYEQAHLRSEIYGRDKFNIHELKTISWNVLTLSIWLKLYWLKMQMYNMNETKSLKLDSKKKQQDLTSVS